MDQQQAKSLLSRYNNGLSTQEERATLENWYAQKSASLSLTDEDIDFESIEVDLRKRTFEYAGILSKSSLVRFGIWSKIAAAAVLVLGLGFAIYFYGHKETIVAGVVMTKDIEPGKTGATLTLSNGKKISLSSASRGELARETGVVIVKGADGQLTYRVLEGNETTGSIATGLNELTTTNGQQYRVQLPDGTLVWLNSASSLRYPASFTASRTRKVELLGEGYFEVAKDKLHPFIVKSAKQQVEVLGTHFNVSAYAEDGKEVTTLLEGSVKVDAGVDGKLLRPGEQSVSSSKGIRLVAADIEEAIAWRTGKLVFNNQLLGEIMKKVSRWYDVEVAFEGGAENLTYQGAISREKKISAVLGFFARTGTVEISVDGRKVSIRKK